MKVKYWQSTLPFIVGLAVHNSAEEWMKRDYPQNFIQEESGRSFNRLSGNLNVNKTKKQELLKRSIKGALLTEKIYRLLKFPEHKALFEGRFNLRPREFAANHRLIGGYDIYDPVTEICYDLKMHTTTNTSDPRQMLTYAVGLDAEGRKVSKIAHITPFLKKKITTTVITPDNIRDHSQVLADAGVAMQLKNYDMTANPGQHCFFCEYRGKPVCEATWRKDVPTGQDQGTTRSKKSTDGL